MATRDVKNIEKDYLICPLCLDTYTEPKVLPCEHSFCRTCLEAHIRESGAIGNQFQCPIDRQPVYVDNRNLTPQQLASSFPDSVFLEELKDLIEGHEATNLNRAQNKCRAHDNKPKDCVCMTCGEVICGHCALLEHNPNGCYTTTIGQAAANLQQNFEEAKMKLDAQLKTVKKLQLRRSGETRSTANLVRNISEIEESLKECFNSLLETAKSIKKLPIKVDQDRRDLEKNIKDASATLNLNATEEAPRESLTRVFSVQAQIEMFEHTISQLENKRDNMKHIEPLVEQLRGFLGIMLDFNVEMQRSLSDINS